MKPDKDDLDLVAAALGLRASVWAQATLHITPRKFNAAINGRQVIKDGERVKKICTRCNGTGEIARRGDDDVPCPVCGDTNEATF